MNMKYTVLGLTTPQNIRIDPGMDISNVSLTLNGDRYAVAVDPSTSSSGIIFGNVETKQPEYMIALIRDRKSGLETQHSTFTRLVYELFDKWITENKEKIIAIKVEQPFKGPKQTQADFAKQMESFYVFTNIAKRHGINCIIIAATKWRSWYLAGYKQLLHLDLRQANKEAVHQVAMKDYLEFMDLPDDATDAYGIWCHYLAVDYHDGTGAIMAPGDNYRDHNHNLIWIVSSQENFKGYVQSYLTQIRKYVPTAVGQEFIINPKLSIEENFRCFTSATTDAKYNLYYAQTFPSIGIIREVVKFRQYIGRINANTPLYIVGYRPK